MKKRGLSSVLATVLIVLMAIIGAIMVWAYVRSSVTESSERVDMQEKCYALDTELQSCEYGETTLEGFYFVTGVVKLKQGDPTELRVAFYAEDGTAVIKDLQLINILETKKILPPTKMAKQPVYAIASPIIYSRDKTGSLVCPISKKMVCNGIKIPGNLCEVPTFIQDIGIMAVALSADMQRYNELSPDCNVINADFSCDGTISYADTDPFVAVLDNNWIFCNRSMICDYVVPLNVPSSQWWFDNQTAKDYFDKTCK